MVTIDERQAFSDRLNLVLDEEGYPPKGSGRQNQLAKDWGLSQKGVRKWLEGEGVPETTRLVEMARRYKVSFEWLATGRNPASLEVTARVVRGTVIVHEGRPRAEVHRAQLRPYASVLVEAIEKADANGLPDDAFKTLSDTLRMYEKLRQRDDRPANPRLLDLHTPGPEEA